MHAQRNQPRRQAPQEFKENQGCLESRSATLTQIPNGKRHLFVVDSLDKQMQNEKEPIRLASAGVGGAIFYLCGEY